MLALLTSVDAWIGLRTLTVLEIVLGIDNIIFLSLVANKLPPERRRPRAASASAWRWCCASSCCPASRG